MRLFAIISLLACHFATAEPESYIEEFQIAQGLEQSDPQASADGMIRCLTHAAAAGDTAYASAAGLNGCFRIYEQGKVVAAGALAREVIQILGPLPPGGQDNTLRRVQLFGFIERGLLAEGKVGGAWQANRAAAETLRGKKVPADADGKSVTLGEIVKLPPSFRSFGLRLIEREAELLNITGRTNEGRKLLDESATYLGSGWTRFDPNSQFYAFKLLAARAEFIDFLGYQEEAIRAQQDLLAASRGNPKLQKSILILRINLLRNLSQWDGPSPDLLDQARDVVRQIKAGGVDNQVDRLFAKMEFDLKQSREAADTMGSNALKNQDLGDSFSASYAERDNLDARIKLGDPNLDADFFALLNKIRGHGNKRGEPTLYTMYGNFLLGQKRPAEANGMFSEALRMTRGFGWVLHEPGLLARLLDARLQSGDIEGARSTLGELDEWIQAHPEAPASRRANAVATRAFALASLGDLDAARAAYRMANEIGKALPAYQQRNYSAEQEEATLKEIGQLPDQIAKPAVELPKLAPQPVEVTAIAVPGNTARTRFTIFNPTAQAIRGNFVLTGPGPDNSISKGATFHAGKPSSTLRHPQTIGSGTEACIEISLMPAAGVDTARLEVAWENNGQTAGPVAAWDVTWSATASRSVVLDASRLEANPFRSVVLYHELAVPLGEDHGIPFRLRSPIPLRFEYHDAATHELLAIDANGNGDFTESGDLYGGALTGVIAAIVAVGPGDKTVTAEIRIFAPDGLPLLTAGSRVVLEAEAWSNGTWTKEAEDTLK